MTGRRIIGRGGGGKDGGGSAHAPSEDPDSLRSRAYARVLDLLCEGEIVGLVDGLKSVYLDETPIESADGARNFTGVFLSTRTGTQSQQYIEGFPSVENEIGVGATVTQASSVARTITNSSVNAARVRLSFPQLTYQDPSTGDLRGTMVQYAIDIQSNGGGYVTQVLGRNWITTGIVEISATHFQASITSYRLRGTINVDPNVTTFDNESAPEYAHVHYTIEFRVIGAGSWTTFGSFTDRREFVLPVGTYSLYEVRLTGISGGSAELINVQLDSELFGVVRGKSTSKYERTHRFELTGSPPWDIRVRRITEDPSGVNTQNRFSFESYTEIIDSKLRYPNSAIVGLSIDSAQFRSVPRRSYDVKMLKILVPTNYDPDTRIYTGSWDGTFKLAWSDNPAWVFFDLVTSDRYGLGGYIEKSQVDKWSLYQIAKYCDEMVPDGFGAIEPRFTCNIYLQTREEAFKVLNDLASVFRGMIYWSSGAITAVQDAPADATCIYTAANVIDGLFNYSGSSAKARHTVALVRWNDPADFYRQKVEYVEDTDGITRYGIIQTEVVAVGCTSRGQAHRLGRWILYSERLEDETVSFRVGLDGAICRPGQIVKIADPNRAGARLGGRIVTATTSSITLDNAVTLQGGVTYTLMIVDPDGTIQESTVMTAPGAVSVLSVSPSFSSSPQSNSIWLLTSTHIAAQTFRVIGVSEVERNQFEITALAHNSSKYDSIEQNLVLEIQQTSSLRATPSAPTDLKLTETLYEVGADIKVKVTISWEHISTDVYSYVVTYKIDDDNVVTLPELRNSDVELLNARPGLYSATVVAVNYAGVRSSPTQAQQRIYGKTAAPADISGFAMSAINRTAQFTWDLHPDLDVRVGGKIVIRYSPLTSGATWQDGVDVVEFPGVAISGIAPLMSGTYMARALDSSGNLSENTFSVTTTVPNILQFNVVATSTQNPAFSGAKSNAVLDGAVIKLDGAVLIDSVTDSIDNWGNVDAIGGVATSGSYSFDNYIDLGARYYSRVVANISAYAYDANDFIDSRINYIDSWGRVEGDIVNDATASLLISTTNDDPAGTPTWSIYQPFFVGDYDARALRFRLDMETENPTHNIQVDQLGVSVDVPDRVEHADNITSGTGALAVTFANAFWATPAIGITAENMATGDYYVITAKSRTGFTVQFKNSAGTGVSRIFDWIAKGYGYAV